MERGTDDGFSGVLEWQIENFSCWNLGIREMILSPILNEFWGLPGIYLYPKGPDGNGEHLEVFLLGISRGFKGELSYIASNGSLICSQQIRIDGSKEERNVKLPTGPKYEDIVARIKRKEDIYNDTLTLRFKETDNYNCKYHVRTVISVYDTSVRIPASVFGFKTDSCVNIFEIVYPMDDGSEGFLTLTTSKTDLKIELALQPRNFRKNIAVRTCMSEQNDDDDGMTRSEQKEHHFCSGDDKWTFANALTVEEVSKKGFSILLRVKIVPKKKYKHRCGYYSYFAEEVYIMPTRFCGESCCIKAVRSNQTETPVDVLAKELMFLYQDQDFSDFQLNCGKVSFPVHRAILSARSPVFKSLLFSDMKEAASCAVDIEDLDTATLARFLTFIYTGTIDDLQCDSALKLYYAADKYQVPTLKGECASVLCDGVSLSSVCDILSLADRHGDDRLTSVAHDFILKNFQQVLKSEEWCSFMKTDGDLLLRTLTHFAQIGKIDA